MAAPIPYVVATSGDQESAPPGSIPIALYGGGGGGGGVVGLNGAKGIWIGTRAEYDALPSTDDKIAYFVQKEPTP